MYIYVYIYTNIYINVRTMTENPSVYLIVSNIIIDWMFIL